MRVRSVLLLSAGCFALAGCSKGPAPAPAAGPSPGGPPPAVAAAIEKLDSPDPSTVVTACETLREAGPAAAPAAPKLTALAKSGPVAAVRGVAAIALASVTDDPNAAFPVCKALLNDPDTSTSGARSLGVLATRHPSVKPKVTPLLTAALQDQGPYDRVEAAVQLSRFAPEVEGSYWVLLSEGSVFTNQELEKITRPAIPGLRKCLDHPRMDVRFAAAGHILRLDPTDRGALKFVTDNLVYEDTEITPGKKVVRGRTEALGILGRLGKTGVPHLTPLLDHPEPGVRQNAASALGMVGPDAAAAVPQLLEACKQARPGSSRTAYYIAFWKIGAAAPAGAADFIRDDLTDKLPIVRVAAAATLARLAPADKTAVPVLTELAQMSGELSRVNGYRAADGRVVSGADWLAEVQAAVGR